MKMKKIVLLILVIVLGLFLAGCFLTPATDVKDIEVKVTAFKQEVSCNNAKAEDTKDVFIVLNGEFPKCGPYCPPQCPGCNSCCPQCEQCEQC